MDTLGAVYDVTLAVPSHGIHNPVNLHSCRPHLCYIPTECSTCKYVIFPLMAAARCVRCSLCYHRECVKDIKSICEHFMMKEKRASSSIYGNDSSLLYSSIDDVEGFDHLFKLSGQPNWSEVLVGVSAKFKISTIEISDGRHSRLMDLLLELLGDTSTFPGAACAVIRRMYLKQNYKNIHTAMSEARQALDQIASSLFCVLPADVASDYDKMKSTINWGDRYALSKNDNGMYEKVMAAATELANSSDEALFTFLNKDHAEVIDEAECGATVTDAFFRVLTAVTAMDKLTALSNALRVCVAEDYLEHSSSLPEASIYSAPPSDYLEVQLKESKKYSEVVQKKKTGSAPHGADALIERLTTVICFLSKRYKLRWHAQCVFIEMMCPDSSWLFGAEGYSFVTLQQVLSSLLQTASGNHELAATSFSNPTSALRTASVSPTQQLDALIHMISPESNNVHCTE